jgi:hypothetical protein
MSPGKLQAQEPETSIVPQPLTHELTNGDLIRHLGHASQDALSVQARNSQGGCGPHVGRLGSAADGKQHRSCVGYLQQCYSQGGPLAYQR